jgi:hypothetical protein
MNIARVPPGDPTGRRLAEAGKDEPGILPALPSDGAVLLRDIGHI